MDHFGIYKQPEAMFRMLEIELNITLIYINTNFLLHVWKNISDINLIQHWVFDPPIFLKFQGKAMFIFEDQIYG